MNFIAKLLGKLEVSRCLSKSSKFLIYFTYLLVVVVFSFIVFLQIGALIHIHKDSMIQSQHFINLTNSTQSTLIKIKNQTELQKTTFEDSFVQSYIYKQGIAQNLTKNFQIISLQNQISHLQHQINKKALHHHHTIQEKIHSYQATIKTQEKTINMRFSEAEKPSQFDYPKVVWTIDDTEHSNGNEITQRCFENIKWFAEKDNYIFKIVTKQNAKEQLPPKCFARIQRFLTDTTISYKMQEILMEICLLSKGGIFIHRNVLQIQSFEWLKRVGHNTDFSIIGSNKVQVVMFYDEQDSSKKEILIEGSQQKFIVQSLALEKHFIVAQEQSPFIKTLLQTLLVMVESNQTESSLKDSYKNEGSFVTQEQDFEDRMFKVAVHHSILSKQKQFDQKAGKHRSTDIRQSALSFYGIYAINKQYTLNRLQSQFPISNPNTFYLHLLKFQNEEIRKIGRFKYMLDLSVLVEIEPEFFKVPILIKKYLVHQSENDLKYTIQSDEYAQHPLYFPEFLRVVWYSPPQEASYLSSLMERNLRRQARRSGYKCIAVSMENLNRFLTPQALNTILQAQTMYGPTLQLQLVKLYLINSYGGLWIDWNHILLDDFNWLKTYFSTKPTSYSPQVFLFSEHYEQKYLFSFIVALKKSLFFEKFIQIVENFINFHDRRCLKFQNNEGSDFMEKVIECIIEGESKFGLNFKESFRILTLDSLDFYKKPFFSYEPALEPKSSVVELPSSFIQIFYFISLQQIQNLFNRFEHVILVNERLLFHLNKFVKENIEITFPEEASLKIKKLKINQESLYAKIIKK